LTPIFDLKNALSNNLPTPSAAWGFAFIITASQITIIRLFNSLPDFGFLEVQGHSPQERIPEKKLRKAAMESVHCKYQSTLMGNYTTPTLNPTSQPQPQSQPLNLNPNPNLSTSTPTSHLNPNLSTSTPTQTSQPQPQPLNLNPTLTSQPQTQPQPLNLNPHPNLSTSNPTPTSQLQPPPQPLNLKPNPNLST